MKQSRLMSLVEAVANNIIGAGIMPRAASGDDTLDRKVDALFERWTAECDADGQLDFYGLQTLICREMVEAGEVLVRRRLRRPSARRRAPRPTAWEPGRRPPASPRP